MDSLILKSEERMMNSIYFGVTIVINLIRLILDVNVYENGPLAVMILYTLFLTPTLVMIIRTFLIVKRMRELDIIQIYKRSPWALHISCFLMVTCHVIFWYLAIIMKYEMMIWIVLLPLVLAETAKVKGVYENDKYVLIDGNKYVYDEIEAVRKDEMYNIGITVDGKEYGVNFISEKNFNWFYSHLMKRTLLSDNTSI